MTRRARTLVLTVILTAIVGGVLAALAWAPRPDPCQRAGGVVLDRTGPQSVTCQDMP